MQTLHLKATDHTPEFLYDVENFTITIAGNSVIEKTNGFYTSITQLLNSVESAKPMRLNIVFTLENICRNSKRGLLFFLMRLKEIQVNCKTDLRITWNYSPTNEFVKILGEDFEYMAHIPIHTKAVEKTDKQIQELAESF